jgi:ubiquinone/menaquinone biosynthesis C-methylase UbiE
MSLVAPHGEHDWLSVEYVDEWIRNDVSRDAERRPKLRRAAALLPFNRGCAIEVVDIGGGYGEFTRPVLEEFPNSSVVLHDFSEPMIVVARERLAAYGTRVDYRLADLRERGWSRGLGGPFDAAVSSIAIHNLRRPPAIHSVYREVAKVLGPGGLFFNLDYVFPRSPRLSECTAAKATDTLGVAMGTKNMTAIMETNALIRSTPTMSRLQLRTSSGG